SCLLRLLTAAFGRLCCKSRFALVVKISAGRGFGFRVRMWGTSSLHVKRTGDFGNAVEGIRIGGEFPCHVLAKNSTACNVHLSQHNRNIAAEAGSTRNVCCRRKLTLHFRQAPFSRSGSTEGPGGGSEKSKGRLPRGRRALNLFVSVFQRLQWVMG